MELCALAQKQGENLGPATHEGISATTRAARTIVAQDPIEDIGDPSDSSGSLMTGQRDLGNNACTAFCTLIDERVVNQAHHSCDERRTCQWDRSRPVS